MWDNTIEFFRRKINNGAILEISVNEIEFMSVSKDPQVEYVNRRRKIISNICTNTN